MLKSNLCNLIIKTIVFFIFSICSCDYNTEEIKDINNGNPKPLGMASDLRMIYTDSMKISAILTSNKHIDFTNLTFKYSEFPEGVQVVFMIKKINKAN